jgi:predicted ester cyclase
MDMGCIRSTICAVSGYAESHERFAGKYMSDSRKGAYGADDDVVDYILGITFEIWEQRGVHLINEYYSQDCVIYGLDGITHGASEVVDGTWATLKAFPNRNLLAEDVIWSGDREHGYYTSHRLSSRATNKGETVYGPATGKPIRMTNIADCVIEEGVIVKEWLIRDNMTLAEQLGADPHVVARDQAAKRNDEHAAWLESEHARLQGVEQARDASPQVLPRDDPDAFALRVLSSCWHGDRETFNSTHAPYTALHRTPFRHYSGRDAVFDYYQQLRSVLGNVRLSVDHVASQPFSSNGSDIAVRWTVSGTHEGDMMGVAPTGKAILILGVTHWHCIADHIAIETTIFDDLAVLSQAYSP